jgi:hypothetical protein
MGTKRMGRRIRAFSFAFVRRNEMSRRTEITGRGPFEKPSIKTPTNL